MQLEFDDDSSEEPLPPQVKGITQSVRKHMEEKDDEKKGKKKPETKETKGKKKPETNETKGKKGETKSKKCETKSKKGETKGKTKVKNEKVQKTQQVISQSLNPKNLNGVLG